MKNPKPEKGLIFNLAYHNDSLTSKIVLMLLGGIGTFIWNVIRLQFVEAVFASASNLCAVTGTAHAQSRNNEQPRWAWKIIGTCTALQAMVLTPLALLIKWRDKMRSDADYDVLAALVLKLWKMPYEAGGLVFDALQTYPDSMLLYRRRAQCLIAQGEGRSPSTLYQILRRLEGFFESEPSPEGRFRLANTLIEGWNNLGRDDDVRVWKTKLRDLAEMFSVPDQAAKACRWAEAKPVAA